MTACSRICLVKAKNISQNRFRRRLIYTNTLLSFYSTAVDLETVKLNFYEVTGVKASKRCKF